MTLEKFNFLAPHYPVKEAIAELGYTDTSFITNI